MEQLIFFAVIIVFSILESVARKRKKQAGTTPSEIPGEWEWEGEEEVDERGGAPPRPPTYGSEPSFDDLGADVGRRTPSPSSEGMIPADIWEEIAGLAKGPQSRNEPPRRAPAPPPPPMPVPVPKRAPAPVPAAAHRVHLAHKGYGTDPSTRARSQQDGLDPLAVKKGADALAVRRQLRSRGAHALRQAVVLREVLGPPAALRRDHLEDRG